MQDILDSRAYSNSFYTLAQTYQAEPDLAFAIREWYLGTRAYCHGLVRYAALLSRVITDAPPADQGRLENAFVVPLHLAAEEFSLGLHGGAGAHYRLFARLGEAVGLSLDELRAIRTGTLPETQALADGITAMFEDVYQGAGCLRVFELVGLKICESFGHLCRRGAESGWFNHTANQLLYVDVHLVAEPQHNDLAITFLDSLCDTPEKLAAVNESVRHLCELVGDFWDAVAAKVFTEASLVCESTVD